MYQSLIKIKLKHKFFFEFRIVGVDLICWSTKLGLMFLQNKESLEFKLDAKRVADAVNVSTVDVMKFGSNIEQCRMVLDIERNLFVGFLMRQTNVAHHTLARASRLYES